MVIFYPHAWYSFTPLSMKHYLSAVFDIIWAKLFKARNLNFHFPMEIVFKSRLNIPKGLRYVSWVEAWSRILRVQIVWENLCLLDTKTWALQERQIWDHVPKHLKLCLDTGHLMVGTTNPRKEILRIFEKYQRQITHLHIHENDLVHDLHLPPGKILNPILSTITRGRTWLIEPSS